MTTSLTERVASEQREFDAAAPELRLHESSTLSMEQSLREAVVSRAPTQPPGTVLLQIIRPGNGEGKGKRYYGPQMLEANAHVFAGARMFRNHLTEKQRKDLEGLPRPIEHLAGRLMETWWDGEVPATSRHEAGAVFGWMRPMQDIHDAIERDPELFEASISALATSITPGNKNGRAVGIVEGIRSRPVSVDLVTEGGAGGRVLSEAAEQEEAMLEGMKDDELLAYLRETRPELVESLTDPEGGEVTDEISPEILTEALASEAGQQALGVAVQAAVRELNIGGTIDEDEIDRIVEAKVDEKMAESADLIRIEARGELERKIELRDMRDRAAELVEGAKTLHPKLAEKIREKFALSESGQPTEQLDIKADVNDEGVVTKSPIEKLAEAVQAEIDEGLSLQASLGTRTRVRGQGRALVEASAAKPEVDAEGKPVVKTAKASTGSRLTDALLQEAGFSGEALTSIWGGE